MREKVKDYLESPEYRPSTFKELVRDLSLRKRKEINRLHQVLDEMMAEGDVKKNKRGCFLPLQGNNHTRGIIQGHPKGFAFLIPDNREEEDVFISPRSLKESMHGDRVLVRLIKGDRRQGKREGEVVKILERRDPFLVGAYRGGKRGGVVIPDDARIGREIIVSKKKGLKPSHGDKVIVKITQWPKGDKKPRGQVDQVLGGEGEKGVDVLSILKKHGLSDKFPPGVIKEAEAVAGSQDDYDEGRRRDLRHLPMVTIDGEDAKDLDDAVSIEKKPKGGWILGVHIADVSYYVQEKGALDKEAFSRGTSVYLVDRVLPMLPPRLSNDICSLNPGVDRLAMSVLMEINSRGEVEGQSIYQSIINVDERMTYKNVAAILEDDKETCHSYYSWVNTFKDMHKLASLLRERRFERGSIDFAFPEPKVRLDEEGHPVSIEVCWQGPAENIIEEFMIICNEVVAGIFEKAKLPFVYRIHEKPKEEKVMDLRDTLALFNLKLKGAPSKIRPSHYQKILEKAKGTRWEKMVNHLLLRSLSQARYSVENKGHFGLASPVYCHFTSPIRRYPDLVVHRLLRHLLEKDMDKSKWEKTTPRLTAAAEHSSARERKAMEAERESVDMKKIEFMEGKEGQEFSGIINGVTSFGIFVELENTVEGLVHISAISGDYYIFDDKNLSLRGERTNKVYQLGDPVTVRLHRVSKEEGMLDFHLSGAGSAGS